MQAALESPGGLAVDDHDDTKDTRSARTASVESVLHAMVSMGRLMRNRNAGDTLDTGTFWLLKIVVLNGPMRVTDLAVSANLDTSTVSRHVDKLSRSGLIERTPDPDDRRAQRVELSAKGRSELAAAHHSRRTLLERSLESWDQTDLEQFDRLLTRFVSGIDTLAEDLEKS